MTSDPAPRAPTPRPAGRAWLRLLGWLIALPLLAWAAVAVGVFAPSGAGALVLTVAFATVALRRRTWAPLVPLVASAGVAIWWFSIPARLDRAWIPECARTASATIEGDVVTLRDLRNFEWRSETEFTPRWETRTYRLSQLRHLDLWLTYWGTPHVCHTMLTFDFGADGRVCVSIEARREHGEEYSALAGMFRRYELLYVFADERDVVRLRTRIRPHNDVYAFRLNATPEVARTMFLDYVRATNELGRDPAWYHSLLTNCSTTIQRHVRHANVPAPWDWRILANGHVDRWLYDFGYITRDLPLADLKRRSLVNVAAREADAAPDFSDRIRVGRPGF
jgi:hypothetical protein